MKTYTPATVKISEIHPHPDNPRKITKIQLEKLKKSITEYPEMLKIRPVIIDETNTILGGNMRYKALIELGHTTVDVLIVEGLTEEQKKEFLIKDNVSFGVWDMDALEIKFDPAHLENWGMPADFQTIAEIKAEIISEEEYEAAERTAADAIEALTTKINSIAEKHPAKLKNALAVIISNNAGNQCLILSDPNTADIITELQRHIDAGEPSPLEKLMQGLQ